MGQADEGFDFGGEPPTASEAGKSAGEGHRARLSARLLTGEAEALADYEILEYLLFAAIKHGDTKPQAKALIAQLGSLASVRNTGPKTTRRVKGVGETCAAALKAVAIAARQMTRGVIINKPMPRSWQALIDYLTTDMAHLAVERVQVLYLDTRNRMIEDHHMGDGSIDEAAIHPREVIRRAMDLGANAMILVHNQPSGSPEPSRTAIHITKRIAEAGRLLGVTVHDHSIIGREGHTSLRAKGRY